MRLGVESCGVFSHRGLRKEEGREGVAHGSYLGAGARGLVGRLEAARSAGSDYPR